MIKTWSGNDTKISLHSTTPNFHSITPLHSTQSFSTCRNNMGLSYFRYNWAQWYPLEIEIHLYSYVQSRLDFNLESPRLHSNLESARLHSNLESPRLHSTFYHMPVRGRWFIVVLVILVECRPSLCNVI